MDKDANFNCQNNDYTNWFIILMVIMLLGYCFNFILLIKISKINDICKGHSSILSNLINIIKDTVKIVQKMEKSTNAKLEKCLLKTDDIPPEQTLITNFYDVEKNRVAN